MGSQDTSLLPNNAIHKVLKENGPDEDIYAEFVLELKSSFGYCTLFGEMMYAYVACCPNIQYVVIKMWKFLTMPLALHYSYLKCIAVYFYLTKNWDIMFKCTVKRPKLDEAKFRPNVTFDENLLTFPVDINQPK